MTLVLYKITGTFIQNLQLTLIDYRRIVRSQVQIYRHARSNQFSLDKSTWLRQQVNEKVLLLANSYSRKGKLCYEDFPVFVYNTYTKTIL